MPIESDADLNDEFRKVEIDFDKLYVVERKTLSKFFDHTLRFLFLDHRSSHSTFSYSKKFIDD